MMARELKLINTLVELDRTSLREQALEMLRKAVTAREIEPAAGWWRRNCRPPWGSRGGRCGRRSVSWSTRA